MDIYNFLPCNVFSTEPSTVFNMLTGLLLMICILIFEYLYYVRQAKASNYWPKRGIKTVESHSLLSLIKSTSTSNKNNTVVALIDKLYNDNPDEKVIGGLHGWTPVLVVRDPTLVKNIMVRDFNHFLRIGFDTSEKVKSLFALEGEEWRIMRQQLSPLFTTGKIKQMMPLFDRAVEDFLCYLNNNVFIGKKHPIEINQMTAKFTLKSTTSIAFGIDIDAFTDDDDEFVKMTLELLKTRGTFRWIDLTLATFFPSLPNLFTNIPDTSDFFLGIVNKATQDRQGKPKTRGDFIDLMIELREQRKISKTKGDGVIEMEITDEMITAQSLVFYTAGFRPSSEAMSFLLYELSLHQTIQDRCYKEIKTVMKKFDEKLTYEALNELEYLSMAFDEISRMNASLSVLARQCVEDYYSPELDLTIEKGTGIIICVNAMHNDPKLFPEPEKFDPDRFSPENKSNIQGGSYLPFGDGPRICIGQRFAKVQWLIGMAHFLYRYKVSPAEKPLRDNPVNHFYRGLFRKYQEIWLNVERREE